MVILENIAFSSSIIASNLAYAVLVYDFNFFRRSLVLSLTSVVSQEEILSMSGVRDYIRALKKLEL